MLVITFFSIAILLSIAILWLKIRESQYAHRENLLKFEGEMRSYIKFQVDHIATDLKDIQLLLRKKDAEDVEFSYEPPKRKKRVISPEHKKKIAEAQKKRHAQKRKPLDSHKGQIEEGFREIVELAAIR